MHVHIFRIISILLLCPRVSAAAGTLQFPSSTLTGTAPSTRPENASALKATFFHRIARPATTQMVAIGTVDEKVPAMLLVAAEVPQQNRIDW